MTTPSGPAGAAASGTLTAREFLFGPAGGEAELREALREADLPGRISGAARRLVEEQAATLAAGFLDVDLVGTAVAGWTKHRQLLRAAEETLAEPGSTRVVEVATHEVTSTWTPRIDLTLGTAPVGHLSFDLSVSLTFDGMLAVVTAGRLARVVSGRTTVTVALAAGGRVLAERSAELDAPLQVRLGAGVRLLPDETPVPSS